MKLLRILSLGAFVAFNQQAVAHHLDDYDARIRAEANLPAGWFHCRKADDCELVSVPCQSGLAVNADHKEEAQDLLNHHFYFCLGSSLEDTMAACEARHCVTEPKRK
ncbi:hypothetical protein ACNHKD_15375 [Methylocystis sp. JAN1]|uniref:hypothetical protein n=1 Tax=Methylocystis sp. JAN1 TaxID=3397211 RepID=UPI003FA239D4